MSVHKHVCVCHYVMEQGLTDIVDILLHSAGLPVTGSSGEE